jgi:chitinase
MSWNYNYGAFSKVAFKSQYNGHMHLLKDPDLMNETPLLLFMAAFWFYMTPQSPKPSMHEVAAGFYHLQGGDEALGFKPGFGLTTNIINGGQECASV